jgi:voltage-gated potassium channel
MKIMINKKNGSYTRFLTSPNNSHFIITMMLFGLILFNPFVPDYAVHLIFLTAAFYSAVLLSADTPRIRRVVICLGALVVVSMIALEYVAKHGLDHLLRVALIGQFLTVFIFLAYCVGISLFLLLKIKCISAREIFATVNLYLILGFTWAYGYMLLQAHDPGSFNLSAANQGVGVQMVYFSFVTLTTLGFGDITPLSRVAHMLTVTEAIIGNLYVAVVVTYLLSVHFDQRIKS